MMRVMVVVMMVEELCVLDFDRFSLTQKLNSAAIGPGELVNSSLPGLG